MQAFILAGGYATRLWPLTEQRAKPLLPLAGKPIIEHLVEKIPAEIPVTVSTNAAFAVQFEEWAKGLGRANLTIAVEETRSDQEKLGALGATAQWITDQKIDDDLLLLTGDNYCGFSLKTFLQKQEDGTALIAAYDIGSLELAKAFGTVMTDTNGHVTAFEEKPKEPKSTLVSTGCAVLPKEALPILCAYAKEHPDNVGGIFEELLCLGKTIAVYRFTEPWFDIGNFHSYIEASESLVGASVLRDPSVVLSQSETEGFVVLGPRCTVRSSRLQNVIMFGNCTVEDCSLQNCILDTGCNLRGIDLQSKMLRSNTSLHASTKRFAWFA